MLELLRKEIIENHRFDLFMEIIGLEIRNEEITMLHKMNDTFCELNMIIAPRCSGKTTVTILDCIYKVLKHPNTEILCVTGSNTMSEMIATEIKKIRTTKLFHDIFGYFDINNIKMISIGNSELVDDCGYIIFHDVAVGYDNRDPAYMIDRINHILTRRKVNSTTYTIIGSQETHYDIYAKIKRECFMDVANPPLYI